MVFPSTWPYRFCGQEPFNHKIWMTPMSNNSDKHNVSGEDGGMKPSKVENHTIIRGLLYLVSLLLIALAAGLVLGLSLPGVPGSANAYIAGVALVSGTILYISAAFLRTGFIVHHVGWRELTRVERMGAVGAVIGLGILLVTGAIAVWFTFDPAATTSSPVLLFAVLCIGALLFAGGVAATRPTKRISSGGSPQAR